MGLAESRCFFQRPEHFAAGFLRLARVAQQLGQMIVHFGRVGVIEQGDGAIGRRARYPDRQNVRRPARAGGAGWGPAD